MQAGSFFFVMGKSHAMKVRGSLWMLFSESVRIALTALFANKLRSILTMLGIIIGVGAVIAMVSVGMGVRQQVQTSIASLGSNMLIVSPGSSSSGGLRGAAGSNVKLKYDDSEAIKNKIKNIDYVSPTVSNSYQIVNGNQNWNSTVQGVTPDFMAIRSLTVGTGSFITMTDMNSRNRVAVIGTTVATNLFGTSNPVGQNIRVDNAPYKVIGVIESKGQSSVGQDQDDVVIVPLTTAQERLMGITYVKSINIQVSDASKMDQVQSEIETLLRQRHQIVGDKEDDFTVRNLTSLMQTMTETTTMITLLLASIAAISLVVGGIGIMNIMMVSVTERTREIGIRKALGATFQNIMIQFLIESVVIGVIGGAIGILFGCLASMAIAKFGNFATVITAAPILLSFFFSVGIGLFFGIYPARKAALLDPIEALRYE
jgi:putative ABC transport system permease protein